MERFAAGTDRVILWVTRALAAIGAACVAGMAALVVMAVIMRYAVGAPFAFTEELAGLLMVSCVFLGMPFVLATHAHIRVGLLYENTGGRLRRVLWVLGQLVFLAFAAIFFRDALADARFTIMLNLRSEVARIQLAPFVIGMAAGVAIAGLVAAWQMLRPPPQSVSMADAPPEFEK
ncbi:TRAP transporter small permease [Roseinatronobacter sp. S2]|uniref:TRAP transporter small permease n=1 Tax=Roseinatronobacter sp. S2 TaxID=3035471 RepID=UPI00240F1A44|nr:TRAP transporter small permease [Roseinatronobacter sp. S2]WFE76486.1 TRAP transporter small permease [Roseinatronobacter sp. S2]